jgi:hypothetical protein
MARLDALACALALLPLVSSQFLTPLTERQLFRVGEVQKIQYRTKLTEYTIALWQQALAGGGATPGPVVVRKSQQPPVISVSNPGEKESPTVPRESSTG